MGWHMLPTVSSRDETACSILFLVASMHSIKRSRVKRLASDWSRNRTSRRWRLWPISGSAYCSSHGAADLPSHPFVLPAPLFLSLSMVGRAIIEFCRRRCKVRKGSPPDSDALYDRALELIHDLEGTRRKAPPAEHGSAANRLDADDAAPHWSRRRAPRSGRRDLSRARAAQTLVADV